MTRHSADSQSSAPEVRRVDASVLDGLDVEAHLSDPARKQSFVTPMFDVIAPRYDQFTRRFSFGMDERWKRELIASALASFPPSEGRALLDVACGTGDLAFALAAARPLSRVLGVDASAQMIAQAVARRNTGGAGSPLFTVGDLTRLELADGSIDLVTAGYALRNVPDWRAGLAELARVVRPGGRLVTLDFYRPESSLWRAAFLGYLRVSGDLVGLRWHGRAVVYGYIARSIRDFASAGEFSEGLAAAGFGDVNVRSYLLGGVAIHSATRR